MRNWFRKSPEKKPGEPKPEETQETQEKHHNISSLYEIVEDHLKSLDYEQLKKISGSFAERFAAHQEIISEIVKAPAARGPKGGAVVSREADESDQFVVIDARAHGAGRFGPAAGGASPDEMILSHYDRMIRSQYDRLIDLTMDFLKGVTEAEVKRLDTESAKIAADVGELRGILTDEVGQLDQDIDEIRRHYHDLAASLSERIDRQEQKADRALRRLKYLTAAVIVLGLAGGAALVLSLIR